MSSEDMIGRAVGLGRCVAGIGFGCNFLKSGLQVFANVSLQNYQNFVAQYITSCFLLSVLL